MEQVSRATSAVHTGAPGREDGSVDLFEVRFFFTPIGEEATAGETLLENMIGQVVLENRSDTHLRDAVRRMIIAGDMVERTNTHSVVADVGKAKETGGLGASHPLETVILFRPPVAASPQPVATAQPDRAHHYAICYNGVGFVAISDPQHNKYPGYVFGTLRRHPNAASAIDEYRQYVRDSRPDAGDDESVEDALVCQVARD